MRCSAPRLRFVAQRSVEIEMATALTFEAGRRPGIAYRAYRSRPVVRMTAAQRQALAALTHEPAAPRPVHKARRGSLESVCFVIAAVGLAVVVGMTFGHAFDVLHAAPVAAAHVDEAVTRAPPASPDMRASAPPRQPSSVAASRTM